MYASLRSIRKAKGEESKHVVVHNNKGNSRGRKFYVQTVLDKSGKAIKCIVHEMSNASDAWQPSRKKRRLSKSMQNQPKS